MTDDIFSLLRNAVALLEKTECRFALAGGLVASIYRKEKRFTEDVDFLLFSRTAEETAKEIIESLGYSASFVKLHQLKRAPMMHKRSRPAYIAVGRSKEKGLGIDFILPEMPWFQSALERAESNRFDFGFGELACITAEDVILAKLFVGRPKDIDDIVSITESDLSLDLIYLAAEVRRLKLESPRDLIKRLPKDIRRALRPS